MIHSNERARALTAELGYEMPVDLDRAIDIFHADGRRYEHHQWPAVRSLTTGEEIVEEFFYAVPEDERLWMRCRSAPVRDPVLPRRLRYHGRLRLHRCRGDRVVLLGQRRLRRHRHDELRHHRLIAAAVMAVGGRSAGASTDCPFKGWCSRPLRSAPGDARRRRKSVPAGDGPFAGIDP